MKRQPIEQQVVVVVGAASGIGRETARQFAARHARLVVSDNDQEGLRSLVDEIRRGGGAVASVTADVADYRQVDAIAERAMAEYGRLDTWVHCAAVALWATFEETSVEEFRRVIDVDLMGQVYGAKAALPRIVRSGGGGLIHISSIEAKRALPYHSAYAAAKHGIDGFLEALRLELRRDRLPVAVTQILPSSINTPLFDKARTEIGVKPMGIPPFYDPSIVAEAILHAAEHPVRDVIVGGAGKALVLNQRFSPRMLDALLLRIGFRLQQTKEPKSANAPNNLSGPVGMYNRVDGDFGKMTFAHSFSTWVDLHPGVKSALTVATGLGIGALLGRRPVHR